MRKENPALAKGRVYAEILKLCSMFNIGKNMSSDQMEFTAELIIEKYYYLKIEDIQLCFKKGFTGDYGRIYDRIDGSVLCEWLDKYLIERTEASERMSLSAHNGAKNIYDMMSSDVVYGAIKDVVANFQTETRQFSNETTPSVYLDIGGILIEKFDTLRKKQNNPILHGMKVVKYRGELIDVHTYLQYRYNQAKRVQEYLNTRNNGKED